MSSVNGVKALSFCAGIAFTLIAIVGFGFLYLRYGHPPVAVSDAPFPMEAQVVRVPLGARIDRELKQPPFAVSEDVLQNGAKLYAANCAFCHGTPGSDSNFGKNMYPSAPQLWKKHATGNVVGVSDDEAGETFWKIDNGIRLTGMPSYKRILSDSEEWDIALLLKNADKAPSQTVQTLLAGGTK